MRLVVPLLVLGLTNAGCAGSRLEQFMSAAQEEPVAIPRATQLFSPTRAPDESAIIPSATQLFSPTRVPPESILTSSAPSSTPPPIPTTTGTPTPIPIIDPPGSLSPQGPWLLGVGKDTNIYALNVDGTGLSGVHIPAAVDPQSDIRFGMSKNNGLIALRSRLPGNNMGNYAIYVFRLPNTEPFLTIPLLSDRSILQPTGQELFPAIQAVGVEGGQPTYLWSPDERYLAFVAALDDVSTDVYVLDIETLDIQRLTDGPNQAVLMGWSPGNRWVVHIEAEFNEPPDVPSYRPSVVWAADLEGGPARFLYSTREQAARGTEGHTEELVGWRNDHEFFSMERDFLGRLAYLSMVNLESGSRQVVHEGELEAAAVDPSTGTLAFLPYIAEIYNDAGPMEVGTGGIQLLKPGSLEAERLDHEPWAASYGWIRWLPEMEQFAGTRTETVLFTADGIVTEVFDEPEPPIASPDGQWLAFIRKGTRPGVVIYNLQGDRIYEVADTQVGSIAWSLDPQGFYMLPSEQSDFHDIIFFPVPHGEAIHVIEDQNFIGTSLMIVYP